MTLKSLRQPPFLSGEDPKLLTMAFESFQSGHHWGATLSLRVRLCALTWLWRMSSADCCQLFPSLEVCFQINVKWAPHLSGHPTNKGCKGCTWFKGGPGLWCYSNSVLLAASRLSRTPAKAAFMLSVLPRRKLLSLLPFSRQHTHNKAHEPKSLLQT